MNKTHLAAAFAVAAFALGAVRLPAQTFTETGDAGNSFAGASGTVSGTSGAGQPLATIFGTLSSATDADVFAIQILTSTTFTATTVNAVTSAIDTQLFLFNSSGNAVFGNNDANGTTLQSTLTFTLAPGRYFLAISANSNDPVNVVNQLLFAQPSNTTDTVGPAPGVNGPLDHSSTTASSRTTLILPH